MTIQEAASEILRDVGEPLTSRRIAEIALDRGMVTSAAQDPVQSLTATIDKNIRKEAYNTPRLVFIQGPRGRLVGLPEWSADHSTRLKNKTSFFLELRARIPAELLDKIKLAEQAKLRSDFDETVSFLLSKGLSLVATDVKEGLMKQLDSLGSV
ncbi:hypothetical protein E3J62_02085 [candidate division TA06 bacterium]|uniref:HTH HARE-type domain-containing protein n=1 Tax=candidate division TA06 bacterium TaxID=2250710 RepID=A0A523UXG9_UNCT6|nr:MAG: hypothetical protein E3J62_02085 [candidate division TA06 bacterium]